MCQPENESPTFADSRLLFGEDLQRHSSLLYIMKAPPVPALTLLQSKFIRLTYTDLIEALQVWKPLNTTQRPLE